MTRTSTPLCAVAPYLVKSGPEQAEQCGLSCPSSAAPSSTHWGLSTLIGPSLWLCLTQSTRTVCERQAWSWLHLSWCYFKSIISTRSLQAATAPQGPGLPAVTYSPTHSRMTFFAPTLPDCASFTSYWVQGSLHCHVKVKVTKQLSQKWRCSKENMLHSCITQRWLILTLQ